MSNSLNKPPSLLLVEDDPALSFELSDFLSHDGFAVHSVSSVIAAERALEQPFDLMVLDLNLPDASGVDFCQRIRRYIRSGIVICSGRSERELRLSLLRSGADAFLVKPVDPEELSAILFSVLRRVAVVAPSPLRESVVPAMWRLDSAQMSLWVPSGKQVPLTAAESLLLGTLLGQSERAADRTHLLEVFDRASMPMSGPRLETLVSRLRSKVYGLAGHQLPLRASYGRGYIFAAHAEVC
jgi:DNA-binding response OmpR family regulator